MRRCRTIFLSFGVIFGIVLFMLGAQGVHAFSPIFVTHNGAGNGSGSSWNDAATLQRALAIAAPGDEIWVATAVYTPGVTANNTFTLTAGVALYGGFVATETLRSQRDWAANPTILSGDIAGDDGTDANGVVTDTAQISGTNSLHVVTADGTSTAITSTSVLDGFTITAGNAASSDNGGGLYCNGFSGVCSPHLANLIFSGNLAGFEGGAIYNDGFEGDSSPSLVNVIFTGNKANQNGGAIYNNNTSSLSLANVVFTGNSAGFEGGAIYNEAFNAISSPSFINVTFSGNSADSEGGAIYNNGSAGVTNLSLVNAILWENSATFDGAQISNFHSTTVITTSLIQGGLFGSGVITDSGIITDGGGNLDADPLFVDGAAGNVRLKSRSPAIDSGTNSAITYTVDLDGNPRKVDGDENLTVTVDMGAYEFQAFEPLTVTLAGNGSGEVVHAPAGSACALPCRAIYLVGTPVTLTATAATGSTFTGWSGECSGTGACHLTIDASNQVTATFTKNAYALTVHSAGNGSGTVTKQPDQATYLFDSSVTLTATADSGSSFTGWSGDCENTAPCHLTINGAKSVTATFTLNPSNEAPAFTSTPGLTATVGVPYTYTISAADPDSGDILTLTAPLKPSWLTLTATGNDGATLSGTPGSANVGTSPVQLRVQDPAGAFDTQNFTITVAASDPSKTGSVQGHVQDTHGNGIAGAEVTLTSVDEEVAVATVQTQTTDSHGDYLFEGVPAGAYTLSASAAGTIPSAPVPVTVQAGKTATVPAITLQPSKALLHLPLLNK